jgi:2,3-dihydroxybenzoate decarboxylase
MNKTARQAIRTGATSLGKRISDYMKENVFITTSGMAWAPAITFVQSVLGVDRVMYAMDYPYQFELYEVDATDDVPIDDEAKKKLFQTNAERVFSLAKG